jgi:hypothetical protein
LNLSKTATKNSKFISYSFSASGPKLLSTPTPFSFLISPKQHAHSASGPTMPSLAFSFLETAEQAEKKNEQRCRLWLLCHAPPVTYAARNQTASTSSPLPLTQLKNSLSFPLTKLMN